jgi:hypothetical protein
MSKRKSFMHIISIASWTQALKYGRMFGFHKKPPMGLLEGGYNNPYNPNERADKLRDFVEKRAREKRAKLRGELDPEKNPGAAPDNEPKKAPQVTGKVIWRNPSIQDRRNEDESLTSKLDAFRYNIVKGLKANETFKNLHIQPATLRDVSHADADGPVEAYQIQFSVTPEEAENMQNTPALMGFLAERKTDANGNARIVLTDLNAVDQKPMEYASFEAAEKGATGMMKGKIEAMQKPGESLDALNQTLKLQEKIKELKKEIRGLDKIIEMANETLGSSSYSVQTKRVAENQLTYAKASKLLAEQSIARASHALGVSQNAQGISMPNVNGTKFEKGLVYLTPERKAMVLAEQIKDYNNDPKALEAILAKLDPVKTLSKVLGAQVGLFTLTPVSQAQNGIEAYHYSVRLPNGQPVSFTIGKEIEPSTMKPTYTLEVKKAARGGKLTKAYYTDPARLLEHLTLDAQAGYL